MNHGCGTSIPWVKGFTLIEVLVALAIVAFGLAALFTTTNQSVRASSYLREKTLAQWIALNRVTEARLEGQPPADEETSGEIKYAGENWRWELKSVPTPVKGIVRLEARVRPEDASEDSWPGYAVGFLGDAVAPPGALAPDWLGEPGSGGSGGPSSDTPTEPSPRESPTPPGESPPQTKTPDRSK